MWKLFRKFQRKSKPISWRFSAPILLLLVIANGGWTPVDRLALVVGNRPVTLSEVRTWAYLEYGQCLPASLAGGEEGFVNHIIAMEKLYQTATEFGTFKLSPLIVRQALRAVDANRGFQLLDSNRLIACHISLSMLKEILRRELVVQHYIRSRSGAVKPGEDVLMTLASALKPDVPVVNLLFQKAPGKNIPDSGTYSTEKH